jgi:glycosyltransferase involved in cell wall biosynthesis
MRIVWVLPDIGSYHYARMLASVSAYDIKLHILQVYGGSGFAEFEYTGPINNSINIVRMAFSFNKEKNRVSLFTKSIEFNLTELRPDVVCVPGWGDWYALSALSAAHRLKIPVIMFSESTAGDFQRVWWKEWIKSRILSTCSSALVGGSPHIEYLNSLRMNSSLIYTGYDTVDNGHFADSAKTVRNQAERDRSLINIQGKFFLCSARFIEKKNLSRVIEAFSRYKMLSIGRADIDATPWKLVVLGDGELRGQLEQLVSRLELEGSVILPGFKKYDELPLYYGLASVFVLASTTEQWGLVVNEAMASGLPVLVSARCGCSADLVRNGQNGFCFDPYDTEQLANLMFKMSFDETGLSLMAQQSQQIISAWSTRRFADGLAGAARVAIATPRKVVGWFDRVLLWILMRR